MKKRRNLCVAAILCACLGLSLHSLASSMTQAWVSLDGTLQAESVALQEEAERRFIPVTPHGEDDNNNNSNMNQTVVASETETTRSTRESIPPNNQKDDHETKSDERNRVVCVTEECMQEEAAKLARVWPERPYTEWCVPGTGYYNTDEQRMTQNDNDNDPKWQGLLLMKTPKCASTTASELVFRVGLSKGCAVRLDHQPGDVYGHRDKGTSFYFGPVRDPASRAMSGLFHFFFKEEEYGRDPILQDDLVQTRLESTGGVTSGQRLGGFMYWYMRTRKNGGIVSSPASGLNQDLALWNVQQLFEGEYDYFMVAERMEESIVVFCLLTGLSLLDVFPAQDSNKSNGYALRPTSRSGSRQWECVWNNQARYTPAISQYLESRRWRSIHYADYIMHRAANMSLDKTIQHYGRDRVDSMVADYQRLKQIVDDHCPASDLGDGCDAQGYRPQETCIASAFRLKFGCGYQCIDHVLATQEGADRTLEKWDQLVQSELSRAIHEAPLSQGPAEPACLTDACLDEEARHLARAWEPKSYQSWCLAGSGPYHTTPVQTTKGNWQGLLLLKTPRSASSTAASVVLRIGQAKKCAVRFDHQKGSVYANRDFGSSFLFGPVRNPNTRAMSAVSSIVFGSREHGKDPVLDDEKVISALSTPGVTAGFRLGGFAFATMRTQQDSMKVYDLAHPTNVNRPVALTQVVQVLNDYDYMMVAERMDESLVVLALLTELDLKDVVPVDLKGEAHADDDSNRRGYYQQRPQGKEPDECVYTNRPMYTPAVLEYLDSDEWRAMHYADHVMYRAVQMSLDKTIDHLGRDRVNQALEEFHRLEAVVRQECGAWGWGGGCDADGKKSPSENCPGASFRLPLGCGYECMAGVLDREPTRSF